MRYSDAKVAAWHTEGEIGVMVPMEGALLAQVPTLSSTPSSTIGHQPLYNRHEKSNTPTSHAMESSAGSPPLYRAKPQHTAAGGRKGAAAAAAVAAQNRKVNYTRGGRSASPTCALKGFSSKSRNSFQLLREKEAPPCRAMRHSSLLKDGARSSAQRQPSQPWRGLIPQRPSSSLVVSTRKRGGEGPRRNSYGPCVTSTNVDSRAIIKTDKAAPREQDNVSVDVYESSEDDVELEGNSNDTSRHHSNGDEMLYTDKEGEPTHSVTTTTTDPCASINTPPDVLDTWMHTPRNPTTMIILPQDEKAEEPNKMRGQERRILFGLKNEGHSAKRLGNEEQDEDDDHDRRSVSPRYRQCCSAPPPSTASGRAHQRGIASPSRSRGVPPPMTAAVVSSPRKGLGKDSECHTRALSPGSRRSNLADYERERGWGCPVSCFSPPSRRTASPSGHPAARAATPQGGSRSVLSHNAKHTPCSASPPMSSQPSSAYLSNSDTRSQPRVPTHSIIDHLDACFGTITFSCSPKPQYIVSQSPSRHHAADKSDIPSLMEQLHLWQEALASLEELHRERRVHARRLEADHQRLRDTARKEKMSFHRLLKSWDTRRHLEEALSREIARSEELMVLSNKGVDRRMTCHAERKRFMHEDIIRSAKCGMSATHGSQGPSNTGTARTGVKLLTAQLAALHAQRASIKASIRELEALERKEKQIVQSSPPLQPQQPSTSLKGAGAKGLVEEKLERVRGAVDDALDQLQLTREETAQIRAETASKEARMVAIKKEIELLIEARRERFTAAASRMRWVQTPRASEAGFGTQYGIESRVEDALSPLDSDDFVFLTEGSLKGFT